MKFSSNLFSKLKYDENLSIVFFSGEKSVFPLLKRKPSLMRYYKIHRNDFYFVRKTTRYILTTHVTYQPTGILSSNTDNDF